jgi:hypothetical protein
MSDFPHLHEIAASKLNELPEDQIDYIKSDWWIGYDESNAILKEFDELIRYPRNNRMPCKVLVGDSQNGKTTLLRRCIKLHPVVQTDDEQIIFPAMLFETPSEPDEGRLYSSILSSLFVAHRQDAAPEKLLAKVVDRLTLLNVRLLMADEFHNMLQGTPRNQRQFLASLKSLLNILNMPLVVAGTNDVTNALSTDTQFVTRFEKLEMPRWGVNKTTIRMIKSMESLMPLAQPSQLYEREKAVLIIGASGNTLGGITDIVKKAGIAAIRKGDELIDLSTLKAVIAERNKRKINGS